MRNKLKVVGVPSGTIEEQVPTTIDSDTSYKSNRCKSLFRCCFKIARKKKSEDEFNDDPKGNDYAAEKLVIKRVPFNFFAISKGILGHEENDPGEGTSKELPLSTTQTESIYSIKLNNQSPLYYSKILDESTTLHTTQHSKNLCFKKNAKVLNENNVGPLSIDNKPSIRVKTQQMELINILSAFHPDLKECERPPKDPCPLNMPRGKRSFAEDITEALSIKGTVSQNSRSQIFKTFGTASASSTEEYLPAEEKFNVTCSFTNTQKFNNNIYDTLHVQSSEFCATKSQNEESGHNSGCVEDDVLYLEKSQDGSTSREETEIIVSQVEVQNMPHKLKKFKRNITNVQRGDTAYYNEDYQSNIKPEKNLNTLQYNLQTLGNRYTIRSKGHKNKDVLNAVLRWKIIIKHHKPETRNYIRTSPNAMD